MILLVGTGRWDGFREGRVRQEDKLGKECQALKWERMKAQRKVVGRRDRLE